MYCVSFRHIGGIMWDIFYADVNMEWPGSQRKVQYRNR